MSDLDSALSMDPVVMVHSLVLGPDADDICANHARYARMCGYSHTVHRLSGGFLRDRSRLLYKYSKILSLLRRCDARWVHVFADDALAFAKAVPATTLLGARDWWLCQSGHMADRADSSLIILRGTEEAVGFVEEVLERCEAIPVDDWQASRWSHAELVDRFTQRHDELVEGCYPNLLFPSYGHAFPEIEAVSVTFNPHTHANLQDHRSNRIIVRHLTSAMESGNVPFAATRTESPDTTAAEYQDTRRRGRMGIVLALDERQRQIDPMVVTNVADYAAMHAYSMFVRKARHQTVNERCEAMLAHFTECRSDHEFLVWLDGDVLFHRMDFKLHGMFAGRSILLNRDLQGLPFGLGLLGVRRDNQGADFLNQVIAAGAAHGYCGLVESWRDFAAKDTVVFADALSLAAHPALYDGSNAVVHYMGYPEHVQHLVMKHDLDAIEQQVRKRQEADEPTRPETLLGRLRTERMTRLFSGLLLLTLLVAALAFKG